MHVEVKDINTDSIRSIYAVYLLKIFIYCWELEILVPSNNFVSKLKSITLGRLYSMLYRTSYGLV